MDLPGGLLRAAPTSWNLAVTHEPAYAVLAQSAEHVRQAVVFAAAQGLRVRAESTGHGALRPATSDELLIVTSELTDVTINPADDTATVGAGAKWKHVIEAAHPHGMAPLSGTSSDVGAVGYTLGGGLGVMVRQYGLAADAVVAAQIVTADGNLRWLNAASEPDLMWALRGGGPNFGVVTALRIKLVPAAEVYAGGLYWPVELTREVLTAYRAWTADLPASITSGAGMLHLPDAPFVPEPMRGQSFVRVYLCGTGDDAERLVAPLREIPGLVADMVGPLPFTRIDEVTQDPVDPLPYAIRGEMVSELSDEVIDYLVEIAPRGAEPYILMLVRHVAGIPSAEDSGLAYGQGDFAIEAVSAAPDDAAMAAALSFGDRLASGLSASATGFVPFNFIAGPEQVQLAYTSEHLAKLMEIKKRHDPTGMFGGDRPISPL